MCPTGRALGCLNKDKQFDWARLSGDVRTIGGPRGRERENKLFESRFSIPKLYVAPMVLQSELAFRMQLENITRTSLRIPQCYRRNNLPETRPTVTNNFK